jgi:rsbT co-antagonist protein RsbR
VGESNTAEEQLTDELAEARDRIVKLEAQLDQLRGILKTAQWEKESILNTLPETIVYQDTQHKILWANRAACESAGASLGDLLWRYCYEVWGHRSTRCEDCAVAKAMEAGQPQEIEKPTPDGRYVVARGYPVQDARGGVVGGIEIVQDITEQKRAQTEREQLQQEVIEAQRRALQELSTPIIPVMDRVIVIPLVGSIDTMRARDITRSLLAGIRERRASVVILDITGVPIVDSGVAAHLNKTIQAARLKGARTIVTGISDAVAETIVDLGIDWSGVETLSDMQTGLVAALSSIGISLAK